MKRTGGSPCCIPATAPIRRNCIFILRHIDWPELCLLRRTRLVGWLVDHLFLLCIHWHEVVNWKQWWSLQIESTTVATMVPCWSPIIVRPRVTSYYYFWCERVTAGGAALFFVEQDVSVVWIEWRSSSISQSRYWRRANERKDRHHHGFAPSSPLCSSHSSSSRSS